MATLTTSPYLRTFNFFCATSLVIFAIAIIALYSETRKLAHKYPADEATEWVRPHNVFYWPTYNISYSPDHLILGAGIVSLITGMAGLALSFAYTETLAKFETVLGLASLGTGLGALIHGMNMHGKAPAIEHGTHWLYGGNVWTLETWTCGLKGLLVVDSEIKDYGVMCRDSVSLFGCGLGAVTNLE